MFRVKKLRGEESAKSVEQAPSKSSKKDNPSGSGVQKKSVSLVVPKKEKATIDQVTSILGLGDKVKPSQASRLDSRSSSNGANYTCESDTDSDTQNTIPKGVISFPSKGVSFSMPRQFNPLDFVPFENVVANSRVEIKSENSQSAVNEVDVRAGL